MNFEQCYAEERCYPQDLSRRLLSRVPSSAFIASCAVLVLVPTIGRVEEVNNVAKVLHVPSTATINQSTNESNE